MLKRFVPRAGLAGVLFALSGCPQCAPATVGEGLSRLTVRNVGAIVSLVNANTSCGFASDEVIAAASTSGAVGSEGSLTLTVTDCVIDFGSAAVELSSDCDGVTTSASGKVTVSATRTVGGVLTGDADNPIVPGGPDALTITITNATFENFAVTKSNSDNVLTMVEGSISGVARPRLAVSASSGACAVATPNVAFSDIAYAASTVHVTTPDNDFDADVLTSAIDAQNGKLTADGVVTENAISGTMTVFGSAVDIAGDGVLDPEFDAVGFASSYACAEDLAAPESFTCLDLTPRLADGAARLSVKMLGTVASLLDADTACGFSSNAVLAAGVAAGTVGGTGTLTLTATDCTMNFATRTSLEADCSGSATTVEGSVTVSGTKTLTGRLTGNPASPIVPDSQQPAALAVTIVTSNFRVGTDGSETALLATSGTLSGTVRPKVYLGADTGVCSVSTPNAGFDDVAWAPASLLLSSDSGSFRLLVDSAELEAANGTSGSGTNELTGTMTIEGTDFTVPSDAAGLDPAFAQAAFDATWQCNPDLATPISDVCGGTLLGTVAGGAAALTVRTFGTVASMVDKFPGCGFGTRAPAISGGGLGDDDVTGTFTLDGAGCTITFVTPTVLSAPDCAGATTSAQGTVVVRGTKTVTGFLTGSSNPAEAIIPTSFKPAVFDLQMTFTDFVVTTSTSTASLEIASGALAGQMRPRVALDPTTGACSIATPNVSFANLTWTTAAAALSSDGNTFNVALSTSDLDAQSGSDIATTNTLTGSITADGVTVPLAGPLDPEFDAAAFDAGYQCAGNGNPVLVPDAACSFRQVLGNAAARLLVKAAGVSSSVLNGNDTCGFADLTPTTAPAITGSAGTVGNLLQTSDANCSVTLPADTTLSTDCNGATTRGGGTFAATSATKSINGFLTGVNPPLFPVTRDAASIALTDVVFTDWNVFDRDVTGAVAAAVTVTGTAQIAVDPIAGRSQGNSTAASNATAGAVANVFSVATPVAGLDVQMATGTVTIVSAGKTFNVAVSDVDVQAFAGAFVTGGSNDIEGSLKVDGELVTIAPGSPLLNPYDQTAFNASYSCIADLNGDVVPHE